jgi:hypothetical protein
MTDVSPSVLQSIAIRYGAIKGYLNAYINVMDVLEQEKNRDLLLGPVNMLLQRMLTSKLNAVEAAAQVARTLGTEKGRLFLYAAAVDIMLNDRQPGQQVTTIPTREETFARQVSSPR